MNSKDYNIIKLRYYTSKYYLKKFHENDTIAIKKQFEAAKKHLDFFWKFVEFLNNKTIENYVKDYGVSAAAECAVEEINETHGIIRVDNEGWYTYLVPKDKPEIYEWIKNNIDGIPYKELKNVRILWYFYKPSTRKRDLYGKQNVVLRRRKEKLNKLNGNERYLC